MNIIKDLAHRRVPHIIGSYIFATTSMILFADWLFNRYEFPEYYTTYILFTFLLLLPSVSLIAYGHGAPGKDEFRKLELIAIPFNIIIAIAILVYLDLSPIQHDTPDNETIMIGKIFSDIDYIDVVTAYINKYGLDNYNDIQNYKIMALSNDRLKIIYDELIYILNSENNYNVNLLNNNDLDNLYIQKGKQPLYYDLRSEMKLLEYEETNVFDYIGVLRDSSLNNIMHENDIEFSLSSIIYELSEPIGGNNLIYLMLGRRYELDNIDTTITENDTTYSYSYNAGYQSQDFILANDDNVSNLISEDYLSSIKEKYEKSHGGFSGRVKNIAENIIITFDPSLRSLITLEQLLIVTRIYGTKGGGADERMDDLLKYENNIKNAKSAKYLKEFRELSDNWTKSEIDNLNNNKHPLSTDNNLWWEIPIPSYLKVDKIYDSTLVAIYFKKTNPYIMIKADDKVYLK